MSIKQNIKKKLLTYVLYISNIILEILNTQ